MARRVYLVGIGMGNPGTLTADARDAIAMSDLVIGAPRMIEPFSGEGRRVLALTRAAEIAQVLGEEGYAVASVLFSGDVGFYSGATSLSGWLEGIPELEIEAIPGISSIAYFCARLLTPWQDAYLVSAHGRECDPVAIVCSHAKTLLLTGGKAKVRNICAVLDEAGLGDVEVSVGERLSYGDEAITRGTAHELAQRDFDDLAVMLVENREASALLPEKLVSR